MKLDDNAKRFIDWFASNRENFGKNENGIIKVPSVSEISEDEIEKAFDELFLITLNKASNRKQQSSYIEMKKYEKYVPILLYGYCHCCTYREVENEFMDRLCSGKSERANKRWTNEEDNYLIDVVCAGVISLQELSLKMGRTPSAIYTRITHLVGVKRLSQKVAGKFIGEINGEQTEADLVGTVYKERKAI